MKNQSSYAIISVLALGCGFLYVKAKQAHPVTPPESEANMISRGEYLVRLGGCTDCHTPKVMTDRGPVDDPSRMFAGHPAEVVLSAPERAAEGPWGAATAGMTAWTGPWGVSFSSNLTPDPDTGLGSWKREHFTRAMRTGKHMGEGRDILPPMPWQPLSKATDEDLAAIFAYLQSLPAVTNRVPDPLPPASRP